MVINVTYINDSQIGAQTRIDIILLSVRRNVLILFSIRKASNLGTCPGVGGNPVGNGRGKRKGGRGKRTPPHSIDAIPMHGGPIIPLPPPFLYKQDSVDAKEHLVRLADHKPKFLVINNKQ